MDEKVRDLIAQNLKDVYRELADQPLPDQFVELLRRLEEKGDDE